MLVLNFDWIFYESGAVCVLQGRFVENGTESKSERTNL